VTDWSVVPDWLVKLVEGGGGHVGAILSGMAAIVNSHHTIGAKRERERERKRERERERKREREKERAGGLLFIAPVLLKPAADPQKDGATIL
jgi:hypothetical protein